MGERAEPGGTLEGRRTRASLTPGASLPVRHIARLTDCGPTAPAMGGDCFGVPVMTGDRLMLALRSP